MTHEEILKLHAEGKIFAGIVPEDSVDCDVVAFDSREEAESFCRDRADEWIRVVAIGETDMEVTDPQGYYSGSGRRYSLVPMLYPEMEER